MKNRIFNVLNFLALNVLFFALYLNFIHKDTNMLPAVTASSRVAVNRISEAQLKNGLAAATQQNTKRIPVEN